MDDDDDDASQSQSPSPSPSPSPPHPLSVALPSSSFAPPAHLDGGAAAVTVATPPPSGHHHHQTLTLALPIQHPRQPLLTGGGGGREDCWSEGATSALIDAWGERYLELSRGNLKQKHWQEVADAVSSRDDYTKAPKTDVQCKNRIDTLKKKYKGEKGKPGPSLWPFFHRLDSLLKPNSNSTPNPNPRPPQARTQSVNPIKQDLKSPPSADSRSDERNADAAESSDSFPPEKAANGARKRQRRGGRGEGMQELTRAIMTFGNMYERVERSRLELASEVEKQRMDFAKELEIQRMQFFLKVQKEITQIKRSRHGQGHGRPRAADGGGTSNHNHHHHHHHNLPNNNNSDSSNNTG